MKGRELIGAHPCFDVYVHDSVSECLLYCAEAVSESKIFSLMCFLEGEYYECGMVDAEFVEVPILAFRRSSFCRDIPESTLSEISSVWVCAARGRILIVRRR